MRGNGFDKAKKTRKGVHSKKRTSNSKTSKFYQKKYRGQGKQFFFLWIFNYLFTIFKNMENKNSSAPSPIDYDHVDLILKEADKHGLKYEVDSTAYQYMKEDNTLTLVDAYTLSFNDWVK